jgi:hypothetical protein
VTRRTTWTEIANVDLDLDLNLNPNLIPLGMAWMDLACRPLHVLRLLVLALHAPFRDYRKRLISCSAIAPAW